MSSDSYSPTKATASLAATTATSPPPRPDNGDRVELDARAPESLQTLVTLFSALEFGLSSLALYQHTADLAAVKLAIESSCRSQFTVELLQQMIWLAPTAYVLSWSMPTHGKRKRGRDAEQDTRDVPEPALVIRRGRLLPHDGDDAAGSDKPPSTDDTPTASPSSSSPSTSESLSDRINAFIRRVNGFITEQVASLTKDDPSLATDDQVMNALKSVALGSASLPEKETSLATPQSIARLQQKRLDKMSEQDQAVVDSEEIVNKALEAPVPQNLQSLPKWLVDKVRRQEHKTKRVHQRSELAQRQRLVATLPQLSDQLQSYALVTRRYVFSMADLVQALVARAPVPKQVEEQIYLLETLVPFWITVLEHDGSQLVKLRKSHKYNTVKAELRKAIASMPPAESGL